MPRLAVHIVTYNSEPVIQLCIQSVLAQSCPDINITVIDNDSDDATCQIVEDCGLSVVRNPENRGYAAAHNQALRLTDSTYVLTLNPDVVLSPRFAEEMMRVADADPRTGSAAGCLLRVDRLSDD